jgi:hypothetical protein
MKKPDPRQKRLGSERFSGATPGTIQTYCLEHLA